MFFDQTSVDDVLKCAYCKIKFNDVVKMLPDCGNSICGECAENLRDVVSKTGKFKCQSCTETHTVPIIGLADNQIVLNMLQLRPQERALPDSAKTLKCLIDDLHDKIRKLRFFNGKDEINLHCDELLIEVTMSVESAIKHLNTIESEFIKEINKYRDELLNSENEASPAKRIKTSDGNEGTSSSQQEGANSGRLEQDLTSLTRQIDEFSKEWCEYFNQVSKIASEDELRKAKSQARDFDYQIRMLESRIKSDSFKGRILKFKKNNLFCFAQENIGKLAYESSVSEFLMREEKLLNTFRGHTKSVNQVLFLPNGNLASCSNDKTIKIWNLASAKVVYELKSHLQPVYSVALLPNGWLASGSGDKNIKIWSPEERVLIKTLKGHNNAVVSLQILSDGNISSCSWDDTIRIWNPYFRKNNLLSTISGHGITKSINQHKLLSNGLLLTCSDDDKDSIIRIWNPSTGILVKSLSTGMSGASALQVLSNDNIAVGFSDGSLRIFDLITCSGQKTLAKYHKGKVQSLLELPNGYLLSAGQATGAIKMFNPAYGTLVKSIAKGNISDIFSMSLSRDNKLLAYSSDSTIKILSLS